MPTSERSPNSLPILVVDDYADVAEQMADLLSLSGYDARGATSGEAALRLADEATPNCVLLDVNMPGMDGVELARKLRGRFGGDVTLIAMTGADQSSAQHSMILGLVDYFLPKPINMQRLMKILAPMG